MNNRIGIILRIATPFTQKFSVLDEYDGHIHVICAARSGHLLQHGALLSYSLEHKGSQRQLIVRDIIHMPLALAQRHIGILHELLELALWSLPLEQPAPHIFELLKTVVKEGLEPLYPDCFKRIIVAKFFMESGLYAESELLHNEQFNRLISLPVEGMFKEKIEDSLRALIDSWLCKCRALHPHVKRFKAFLVDRNGG